MIENAQTEKAEILPYAQRLSARIPEVDGLRGVAILGVLVYHLFSEGIDYEKSHRIVNFIAKICLLGSQGVKLFFVISGFLISGILIDNRKASNYFRAFYVRRALRIIPLYYLLLFIFFTLSVAAAYKLITLPDWVVRFTFSKKWYLAFAQNFPMVRDGNLGLGALSPTWTLAIEEQFYIVLPFIIFFTPPKFLNFIVLALICSASIFREIIWHKTSSLLALQLLLPGCFDSLMLGVLIAFLVRSPKTSILLEKYRLRLIIPVFLIAMTLLQAVYKFLLHVSPQLAGPKEILGIPVLNLFCGMLVILTVTSERQKILSKFLSTTLLRKIGELSYFIYLFHMGIWIFVRYLMQITNKPPFGIIWFIEISITLLITWVLARFSWNYIEKPLIILSHRFRYNT